MEGFILMATLWGNRVFKKLYLAVPGLNNYIIWFFINEIAVRIIKIKL